MSWLADPKTAKVADFIQTCLNESNDSSHRIFTPFELCDEIVGKIPSLEGNILVVANLEFVYTLIARGVDRERIYFATPCRDVKAASAIAMKLPESNIFVYNNVITKEDVGDMKFDVVVGNPPYSEGGDDKPGGDAKLYQEFALAAMKLAPIVAFITPGTFKRQPKFKKLRQAMDACGVDHIQKLPYDVFGKDVRVDDPTYWIVGCGGTHTVVELTEDEHDRLQSRIKAVTATDQRKWVSGQAPVCNHNHAAVLSPSPTGAYKHPYVDRILVKGAQLVYATNALWKKPLATGVAISQGCGHTPVVCFFDTPFAHSQNVVAVECTRDESENFKSNMQLKFSRYLLKVSGRTERGKRNSRDKAYAHTAGTLTSLIPDVLFTRSWTDEELYAHFNLTEEEIKLIEDTIKDPQPKAEAASAKTEKIATATRPRKSSKKGSKMETARSLLINNGKLVTTSRKEAIAMMVKAGIGETTASSYWWSIKKNG